MVDVLVPPRRRRSPGTRAGRGATRASAALACVLLAACATAPFGPDGWSPELLQPAAPRPSAAAASGSHLASDSGVPSGSVATTAMPRRPRGATFDRELLPRPSVGGWTPMDAETWLTGPAPLSSAQRDDAGWQEPGAQQPEHWSGLPLMSEMARERGIELPEPFGLGVSYAAINRPSNVDAVRAGVNGGGLTEIAALSFEAEAQVEILLARFDAWVLPMLNVYVLGGYVWNESSVDVTVDLPGAPNTSFTADGDLEGPMYGAGVTAVGGYGRYFMLADFNWNKVELGGLSEMDARLLSARIGFRTSELDWAEELRVYFATTFWDTARTIAGSIQTGGGGAIDSIQYAVDQSPVDPWTFGVGAHLGLTRHTGIVLEAQGYDETFYVVGGFTFRF
jgi:hypothetical protein